VTRHDCAHTDLLEWFCAHGGWLGPVGLRTVGGMRGLYATERLEPGDLLLRIPTALMFTAETAMDSRLSRAVAASGHEVSQRALLATLLVSTRRAGGFCSPYVRTLPGELAEHPLHLDDAVLRDLGTQGTAYHAAQALRAECRDDFESVRAALAGTEAPTADEFRWAYACVVSRAFKFGASHFRLLPMIDMMNHSREPAAECAHDDGGVRVRALRRLGCGDEITNDYAVRSNGHLFALYGFCDADSASEEAPIVTPGGFFVVPMTYAEARTRELFSHLRATTMGPLCPNSRRCDLVAPLSLGNEIAALRLLRDACEWRLGQFDTRLEEDDVLIRAGGLAALQRNIVMARRSEKRVLARYLDLARAGMCLLAYPSASIDDAQRGSIGDEGYVAELMALITATQARTGT
jgi:hypothetical protein